MKEREYLEDYAPGEKFTSPSGRTITETDLVNWAYITGQWHPLHTDKEYAKGTIFGERIAPGMMTLTLGASLAGRLGPNVFAPKSVIALLGWDKVRFPKPVKIGDTIYWEGTVISLEPKSNGRGILCWNCEVKNQIGDVVVSYIHKALVGRDPQKIT